MNRKSPIKIDNSFVKTVLDIYDSKHLSTRKIALILNCSSTTICKILKSNNRNVLQKNQTPLEIGKIYGNLKVLNFDHKDSKRGDFYLTECINCGKRKIRQATYIRRETIKCCKIEKGYSKTRLFGIWMGVRQRCNDKNCVAYVDYGDRGITICDDWNKSFKIFRAWALNNGYKEGLSLERIDVNGNYCPENCRWITMYEQAINKRNTIRFFSKNIAKELQNKNWKKIRQYGLLLFSKLVKARAGFVCELCKKCEIKKSSNLHAHHWYYKKNNSITDIMPSNGICLCKECHKKVHRNYDFYKNEISKLKRFMAIPKILDKVVNKSIDFIHAREIILRSRKDLRNIYAKNKYKKDMIINELLKTNKYKKFAETKSEE